jgi:hypothetical protein
MNWLTLLILVIGIAGYTVAVILICAFFAVGKRKPKPHACTLESAFMNTKYHDVDEFYKELPAHSSCIGKECAYWTSDGSGCKGFLGDCPYSDEREGKE